MAATPKETADQEGSQDRRPETETRSASSHGRSLSMDCPSSAIAVPSRQGFTDGCAPLYSARWSGAPGGRTSGSPA